MSADVDPDEKPAKPRPTHYRVVCFSLYTQDIARLDALVAEMKRRGWTKASKSALIRLALAKLGEITLDDVPLEER